MFEARKPIKAVAWCGFGVGSCRHFSINRVLVRLIMWLVVNFIKTPYGLKVWTVGSITKLKKPVINIRKSRLWWRDYVQVQACFKQVPRAGNFCKRPHKLIDWKGSHDHQTNVR
jgi:hypothetical protein